MAWASARCKAQVFAAVFRGALLVLAPHRTASHTTGGSHRAPQPSTERLLSGGLCSPSVLRHTLRGVALLLPACRRGLGAGPLQHLLQAHEPSR